MKKRDIAMVEIEDCEKLLKKVLQEEEEEEGIIGHSNRVKEIASQIVATMPCGNDINKGLLKKAAILHDIAKFTDRKKHHKKAAKILKKYFKDNAALKCVCSMIRAHKKKFKPLDEIKFEAAILRMADKIDRIWQGKTDTKYGCSMKKIEEFLGTREKCLFVRFQQVCAGIRKKDCLFLFPTLIFVITSA